jgi:hypothetical protein
MQMNNSRKELLEELLIPIKEKYETDNYVIVSGKHIIKSPNWECFDLTESLIHKKDIKILEEFLKDKNTKIEWFISHNGSPYIWDDFCLDFVKDYDEDYQYRLKKIKCNKGYV